MIVDLLGKNILTKAKKKRFDNESSDTEIYLVVHLKLVAVDGLSTSSVTTGEVTTLAHEVGDNSVERGALEVERLATLASAHFTSA